MAKPRFDLAAQVLALGADSLLPPERAKRRPPICEGCGKNRSDPPSPLCPGCQAYQEHQQ